MGIIKEEKIYEKDIVFYPVSYLPVFHLWLSDLFKKGRANISSRTSKARVSLLKMVNWYIGVLVIGLIAFIAFTGLVALILLTMSCELPITNGFII